ncbi:benzoate/H(+) symporter BenE family transporter [Actinomadura parmotrematis]|uniref:benzoate/H(+) symporter BenE family transporter n=1 Tax=Actinomadura parmotrematis TaxID=2864039 RepID=UPI0027E2D0D9|nr:benzoate/H(+) symporter BenE family transporter [Actinomadura parmotrematis]
MTTGLALAMVGFTSSFAVVLAGLRAAGASPAQAASGLLALCAATGLTAIYLGLRHRMPLSIAWSTPGAALLVSMGPQHVRFGTAVAAFLVTGALLAATGLSARATRLLEAVPAPLAAAMLAGILLPICAAPVQAVVRFPARAAPIVIVWAVLFRFARGWAVPGALAATLAVVLAGPHGGTGGADPWPAPVLTAPDFTDAATVAGIALPLFLVTMASQNLAGMSVLAVHGYRPRLRPVLVTTGAATLAVAPLGGHAVNLAAITAAMAARPDAHPDPARRWIASVTGGAVYVVLGLAAGAAVVLTSAAPPLLIESVAGLALVGTLGSALHTAVSDPGEREAAVVAFAVTVSGIAPFGIGGAFWGLLAGLAFRLLLARRSEESPNDLTARGHALLTPDKEPR